MRTTMMCKYCSSSKVVKNGFSKGTQRYLCKICQHKFLTNNDSFVRMRSPSHVVVAALNLYYEGLSVRKTSTQLYDIFGIEVTQVTIWNWIQKYGKMVSEYVETLQPNLSGKYHHDETEIKVGGKSSYFWEMIDNDTRFLVAHHLSTSRTSKEAMVVFAQALKKQRPIALFTDGSFAYDEAFSKVFYTRFKANRVEWIRRVGVRARETNNIVERLHGTLKDRLRPMRGLKDQQTAKTILDGYVTHYNFVRKHQAIGKTPSESCGLEIKGWKDLIIRSQIQATKNECEGKEIVKEIRV